MRLAVLFVVLVGPCLGQFTHIEIRFQGIGCASCTDSLESRLRRVRGVESAHVDAALGKVEVTLKAPNRVRLEQIRDMIQQDGSKTTEAAVRVRGELSERDGKWTLRLPDVDARYELKSSTAVALKGGTAVIEGDISDLAGASGMLAIMVRKAEHVEP